MRLFKRNSERLHNTLMKIKLLLGTLAISSFATDNHRLGFYLLLAPGAIDIVAPYLFPNIPEEKEAKNVK